MCYRSCERKKKSEINGIRGFQIQAKVLENDFLHLYCVFLVNKKKSL